MMGRVSRLAELMAKEKKSSEDKVVVAELNVHMHCNACERTVANVISKFKGVEKFTTDMRKHKVVVTGKINPENLMKKLKKKTGKRVEMAISKDDSKDKSNTKEGDTSYKGIGIQYATSPKSDDWSESLVFTIFSDENPNACSIM